MASQIIDVITSLITQVSNIPFTWLVGQDMPVAGQLFQWVAVWNNQLKQWKTGKGFPVQRPCCFIELDLGKAQSMGLGVSLYADVCIKLHIVDWEIDEGNGTLDQNLEVYGYRDLLKTAMSKFFPLHCGCLNMISEDQDYEHTGVYHYIIEFKTSFSDLQGSILNPDQTQIILTPPPMPANQWGLNSEINFVDEIAAP